MASLVSENVEEYMEAIYRLIERKEKLTTSNIAKELGVSAPSVTEMLRKLDKMGYIKYEPYREVSLTKEGRHLGRTILRRHRLLERFLETLGVSKDKLHHEACKLEHSVSDEVERAIEKKMTSRHSIGKGIITLAEMKPGERGEIVGIETGRLAKRRLEDMGLTPGTKIYVVKAAPFGGPVEISIRGSTLALGRRISMRIMVNVK